MVMLGVWGAGDDPARGGSLVGHLASSGCPLVLGALFCMYVTHQQKEEKRRCLEIKLEPL